MKIYTLHSIADNGLSLSPKLFYRFLVHTGKKVGFVDPLSLLQNSFPDRALITFDDCFSDNFSNALPLLKTFDIKCIFFFSPVFLGRVMWGSPRKGNWSQQCGAGYDIPFNFMAESDLRVLIDLGHSIGFHSRTHKDLIHCSTDELYDEIFLAKLEWEKKLGIKFDFFAYPRGKYDERMFPILAEAGYKFAFSTGPAVATKSNFEKTPFCIPRMPVERRGLFGWL
jgi:peptidoglycan/xylan/chitin deacetylase (PgdA/CDA1 family)